MTRWIERPPEEARLLNPAFLAYLLTGAAADFHGTSGRPMPWTLSFVILPLALLQRSREALPGSIQAHFSSWLQEHPEIHLGFAQRAKPLVPIIKEGLRLALHSGALKIEGGALRVAIKPRSQNEQTEEVAQCLRAARFIGRWLARRHDVTTILGLLGVRP
jgi:hypothetical protein